MGQRESRRQEVSRDDITDAQGGPKMRVLLQVAQRMLSEGLGQTSKMQRIEIEALQRRVERSFRFEHHLGRGVGRRLHGGQQFLGELRQHLVGSRAFLGERSPATPDLAQGFLHRRRRHCPRRFQRGARERTRVHCPRPRDHIVGFVDQHADTPAVRLHQAIQEAADIEIIVVVGNDHIAPACHFTAQVIRADLMRQRHFPQCGAVKHPHAERRTASRRQAVVEPAHQRAGVTVARFVRVLARLVARG